MATTDCIDVAAAVILNSDGRILLSLRNPDVHQGNKWEFPGGKFESDESALAALQRELEEELDILVSDASEYLRLTHTYPEKQVRLHVYKVTTFDGTPKGMEGQTVRWFELAELAELSFPDANYPILAKLEQEFGAS